MSGSLREHAEANAQTGVLCGFLRAAFSITGREKMLMALDVLSYTSKLQ